MEQVQCLVRGDKSADIIALLVTYTTNKYPSEYTPTVFLDHSLTLMIESEPYSLKLTTLVEQEGYEALRPLSFPGTDIFLLCFSVEHPSSLKYIVDNMCPEILRHCPHTPFLLVGTNIDLRIPSNPDHITMEMGRKMAKELGAIKYVECSALTQMGLKNVFDEAVLAVVKKPASTVKKVKTCCLS